MISSTTIFSVLHQRVALSILLFVLGLLIGSFANVVIYRVPIGNSIVKPASFCPKCKTPIKWYDNIPVLSYFILLGTCRHCKEPISFIYPMVEMINAILYMLISLLINPLSAIPLCCVFSTSLIVLSVIDLKHFRLPSVIIYSTLAVELPLIALASFLTHDFHRFFVALLTALGSVVCFLALFLIAPRGGFGLGDVRLSALLGIVLGWFSYKLAITGFVLGFILGGIYGIILLAFGKKKLKDKIAFGPFLAVAALIVLLTSASIFKPWVF